MIKKLIRQMLTAQIFSALTVSLCLLIDSIIIGRGNPEWGAPVDRDVFIIKHHREPSPFVVGKNFKR